MQLLRPELLSFAEWNGLNVEEELCLVCPALAGGAWEIASMIAYLSTDRGTVSHTHRRLRRWQTWRSRTQTTQLCIGGHAPHLAELLLVLEKGDSEHLRWLRSLSLRHHLALFAPLRLTVSACFQEMKESRPLLRSDLLKSHDEARSTSSKPQGSRAFRGITWKHVARIMVLGALACYRVCQ